MITCHLESLESFVGVHIKPTWLQEVIDLESNFRFVSCVCTRIDVYICMYSEDKLMSVYMYLYGFIIPFYTSITLVVRVQIGA
jgi:hypothetical protein